MSLQVKKFYSVLERFVGSEGIFVSIDALHDAAQKFVNETNVRVVSIDTTAVQSALCCAVWYYDAAEPGSSSSSVKKVKVKRAASVEEATNEASTSSSSLSSKKSVATSAPPLDDSGAFVDPEGGTEMQTRAIIKPKKSLPRKYAKSALRVAFKPVDYSQGETVVVKLRCKLNGDVKEHVFSAKKPTLETLGYANLDEGVVELKDLALITMHFLVDELNKPLASIDVELHAEDLLTFFPNYRTAVAKPSNAAGGAFVIDILDQQ